MSVLISVPVQEIASYLISFDRHDEWLSCTLRTRYALLSTTQPARRRSGRRSHRLSFVSQAEERQHRPVQQEEGEVQEGRILLEEKEGWKDDERGPHEAEGPGHGGQLNI